MLMNMQHKTDTSANTSNRALLNTLLGAYWLFDNTLLTLNAYWLFDGTLYA
jgi:hypothetical protein